MDEQWHKCLVLALKQLGIIELLILPSTMESLAEAKPEDQVCAIVDQQEDGIHIRIATVTQAKEYMGEPTVIQTN